jgi:hypothetical protein
MRMRRLACLVSLATAVAGCASPDLDDDEIDDENWGGKGDGALSEDDFWATGSFYFVRIDGWDPARMTPDRLAEATEVEGAEVRIYRMEPDSSLHCPDAEVGADDLVYSTEAFSLRTSGNFTNGTPKSSYKIGLTNKEERLYAMKALNLKAMWNDVSQMRESLAWSLFREAGVPASRHTYARLCINDRYYGLYSMIEQVDKAMLKDHFGKKNDDGNLYKAYWADLGPATLAHRRDASGDDSGRQYFTAGDLDARTYQLKTNDDPDDDTALQTYDDLAALIRAINGVGLPGGDARFDTPAYQAQIESIFNVKAFLRWASVNVLIGAWDNYWRTPANYHVYDSGRRDVEDGFMASPYFTWLPWDYDNSFGIDFFGVPWQAKSIVNWESAGASLPLIRNLLANRDYLRYYLDHMEYMLDCCINDAWIERRIGEEGRSGLWERLRHSAFLEAATPTAAPHTGRQFTNDQVYWNGFVHHELRTGSQTTLGILHFVRMRHDSARAQLATLREAHPSGSSGARFPAEHEALPDP